MGRSTARKRTNKARWALNASLRKRDVLPEEGPGRRSVEAVVDVCRTTRRVACDRRSGDNVRLGCAGTEKVRAAGVAVACATVAGRRVLRDPEPGLGDRVQRPNGDVADVGVVERVPTRIVGHGLGAVPDRRELLAS